MECSTVSFLLVAVLASGSRAFHTGAPDAACSTMLPGHGPSPQTDKSPYRVIMQTTEVGANEPVDILLTAASSGPPFKGFLIEVHPRNGDQPVGQFDPNSDENAQAKNCDGKTNSAMTHKDLNLKTQVKLKWTPPGEGEYVPVVTWVKQQDTFWVKEMADKTIKVSGASESNRTPGGAAEEAKPKQEGNNSSDNADASKKNESSDTSGQSHAVSSLNNISTFTVVTSIIAGTLVIRRLF